MPKNYKRKYAKNQTALVRELKSIRRRQNLRLDVLAEIIGYNERTVGRWEIGYKFPSFFALDNWCKALNCELVVRERA